MSPKDLIISLILTVILILGAYQVYFFPQRNPIRKEKEFPLFFIDRRIPFMPEWVWIYSGLYYPFILSLIFTMNSFKQFNYTAFNFFVLLILQLVFFFLIPIKTPEIWRKEALSKEGVSARFLKFIHKYDSPLNCFPSMHTSVSMLVSLHIVSNIEWDHKLLIYIFPLLIGLSCLYTKQHYVIDILGGIILALIVFKFY